MDSPGTVLSVRGQARRVVPPDSAVADGNFEVVGSSKAAALAEASAIGDRITSDLAALGAVVQTLDTARHPLTWVIRNVGTRPEIVVPDPQTNLPEATGRIFAWAALSLTVRDFGLLDPLAAGLAGHESFRLHSVTWHVDDDNPGWRVVRADAIREAIRQGQDYASALGASLVHVEQIADAGLLGGAPQPAHGGWQMERAMGVSAMAMSGDPNGGPSLTPVPQEITATIEARFTTTAVTLPNG
jgi:uncharacterized protein YggE